MAQIVFAWESMTDQRVNTNGKWERDCIFWVLLVMRFRLFCLFCGWESYSVVGALPANKPVCWNRINAEMKIRVLPIHPIVKGAYDFLSRAEDPTSLGRGRSKELFGIENPIDMSTL